MSSDEETASVLLFFCLFIVYAGTTIFCLLRIIKLHKFAPDWRKAQFFYVFVLLEVSLRTTCMIILASQQEDLSETVMYLLISTPDSLFLLAYVLLIWQLVSLYFFAHIEDQTRQTFLSKISRKPKTSKIGIFILLSICAFGLCQISLYLITASGGLSTLTMARELDILNLVLPGTSILLMAGLSFHYSGIPLKSGIWKQRLRQILRVSIFWTLTRLFRGLLSLIGNFTGVSLTADLKDNKQSTENFVMLVIILVISEIMCVYIVQDYGFMGIFIFSEEEAELPTPGVVRTESQETWSDPLNQTQKSWSEISNTALINLAEIQEGDEIAGRKNGLGKLYKSTYKDTKVVFRKITLPRLSGYVIEELTAEIEVHRAMHFPQVLPVIGIIIELPIIGFICPLIENSSLFHHLHIAHTQISLTKKLQIAEILAQEFVNIHSQGKAHGHFSSHNILLDDNFNPYICDLGFHKVKKYAGIVSGYTNIGSWSSPELLNDRRLTPIKAAPTDDVYSFGMVLWEMISEQEPFPGFSRKQLLTNVVEQGQRPMLNSNTPEDIASIIHNCWNPEPKHRPDFFYIQSVLASYSHL